jgi:hypothetical protein
MQDSEASSLSGRRWGGLGCGFDLPGQGGVHESETVGSACVVVLSSCLLGLWCCLRNRWRSEGRWWLAQSQSVRDGPIHNLDQLQQSRSHCTYPCSYAIAAGRSVKNDFARLSASVAYQRNNQPVRCDGLQCAGVRGLFVVQSSVLSAGQPVNALV